MMGNADCAPAHAGQDVLPVLRSWVHHPVRHIEGRSRVDLPVDPVIYAIVVGHARMAGVVLLYETAPPQRSISLTNIT